MSATTKEVNSVSQVQLQGELSVPVCPVHQWLLCYGKAACVGIPWVGKGVMVSQLGGRGLPKDIGLLQKKQLCREAEN